MASLKNLTGGQLDEMLANTKAEIKRRESIKSATAEIYAVLKKYKITMQDISMQNFARKPARKNTKKIKSRTGKIDKRAQVRAKYSSPNGADSWSGRGRAPSWVLALCQKEGIDLATFKTDKRFLRS